LYPGPGRFWGPELGPPPRATWQRPAGGPVADGTHRSLRAGRGGGCRRTRRREASRRPKPAGWTPLHRKRLRRLRRSAACTALLAARSGVLLPALPPGLAAAAAAGGKRRGGGGTVDEHRKTRKKPAESEQRRKAAPATAGGKTARRRQARRTRRKRKGERSVGQQSLWVVCACPCGSYAHVLINTGPAMLCLTRAVGSLACLAQVPL
jgi:hypothetical protein